MFFSLITPSPDDVHRAAFSRLGAPYVDHQWLWRFFPAPEGHPRDFLFRRADVDGLPRYYTVSARRPERHAEGWEVQVRDYAPALQPGTPLRFELRANPVVTHQRDGKAKRDDVVMHAKRQLLNERGLKSWDEWHDDDKPPLYELVSKAGTAWLKQRAEAGGFSLDEAELSVEAYTQHGERRPKSARGKPRTEGVADLSFSTVDFSGTLVVTDAEAFRKTLFEGLGHAKAFGCGLMLVKRI